MGFLVMYLCIWVFMCGIEVFLLLIKKLNWLKLFSKVMCILEMKDNLLLIEYLLFKISLVWYR